MVTLVAVLLVVAVAVVALRSPTRASATLDVTVQSVERSTEGSGYAAAPDGVTLHRGDAVRTNASGRALIEYFEGSSTLLDADTEFKVLDLVDISGRTTVAGRLVSGRIWNRVRSMTDRFDRFEIRTPKAWVTARGTTQMVTCDPDETCQIVSVEDTTEVAFDLGLTMDLEPGECVQVTSEGGPRPCGDVRELLCSDGFARSALEAQGLTDRCSGAATASPTPSPSPTPTSTPTRVGGPAPTATDQPVPTPGPTAAPTPTPVPPTTSAPPPATSAPPTPSPSGGLPI